jgi:D-inositol-3-phosphate glycosyltransferase
VRYKRIAVISYHTCPLSDSEGKETGGMNVYVMESCKRLAEKGYGVDVYTRSQDKNSPKIVDVSDNLRVIHIAAGEEKNVEKKKLITHISEFTKNLLDFIDKNKITYDLIYSHYYLSGIIGLQIKKQYNLPLFVTFHTLALMKNLVARDESEREGLVRIKYELLLVKKADKIIATSESDREYLITLYNCPKNRVFVVTPGVDLKVFNPKDKNISKEMIGADKDHKLILFVGRIEPLKGIDVLLYAMKILLKNNPEIRLCLWVLGGDLTGENKNWSKELKRLNELKELLNISTAVTFVGRKKQNELSDYYNASEIVILPSQYESFGIAALEAMACGIPVITTDTTGVAGILDKQHSSLITSANNPLLLADKIKNLLTNEKEYEKLSHEVIKKVSDLTWEDIVKKLIKIIEN